MRCKFCASKCDDRIRDTDSKPLCTECFQSRCNRYSHWSFLRTFKPMLKRARGTASYQDVRQLIQLWMWAKRIRALLDRQNDRLYKAARERDLLLWEKR